MTESDFNPNFRFDASGFEPNQAAWEFSGAHYFHSSFMQSLWLSQLLLSSTSGALEEAKKAQLNSKATTIDQKIQQRLQASKALKVRWRQCSDYCLGSHRLTLRSEYQN
jgi:hypothetical protein